MTPQEFQTMVDRDWLEAFNYYSSFGECQPKIMYWTGVSTIASVLQRKVYIDCINYQWTPNFYILIVGEQSVVRKSTSIDIGMDLAKKVPGVHFGADASTWQAFVRDSQDCLTNVTMDGREVQMTCVTVSLSEFGTFFNPDDREQTDVLTDLWDGKLKDWAKRTKGSGNDKLINPWINILAATTPAWIAQHVPNYLTESGLFSRVVFLRGTMPTKDVAYPHRRMPPFYREMTNMLVGRLNNMACLAGKVDLTEEAYLWGEDWYDGERAVMRKEGVSNLDTGFRHRKQGHLHKLAIVVAASRGSLPIITIEHLKEAARQLEALNEDMGKVMACIGQTEITAAMRVIVEQVEKHQKIEKFRLYRMLMRTLEWRDFEAAVKSAIKARLILEAGSSEEPTLVARG